ncbi:hypothetical protein V493_02009 [Pseudogymnoascus sp. VKM F-4281 (FW-2241)]|nr:hypothetical protein V493_02009 [Pseudogymnoascus sp. VKM F-4281 (FW-2241)]
MRAIMVGCRRCTYKDEYELALERESRLLVHKWKKLGYNTIWFAAILFVLWTSLWISRGIYHLVEYGVGPCPPCLSASLQRIPETSNPVKAIVDATKRTEELIRLAGKESGVN